MEDLTVVAGGVPDAGEKGISISAGTGMGAGTGTDVSTGIGIGFGTAIVTG
ncbi:hypothetical protein [Streptomyces sp. NPDC053431]|uniref:hypothetical protein n=1 Tax=Streptomyces sp. NPDC053431 TaxID=3365703 RepID=UPI0037D1FD3B